MTPWQQHQAVLVRKLACMQGALVPTCDVVHQGDEELHIPLILLGPHPEADGQRGKPGKGDKAGERGQVGRAGTSSLGAREESM